MVGAALLPLLPLLAGADALDNGLGFTPVMGWNSWNRQSPPP